MHTHNTSRDKPVSMHAYDYLHLMTLMSALKRTYISAPECDAVIAVGKGRIVLRGEGPNGGGRR